MDPERWQQIEEKFHAALEIEPDLRGEYLRSISGDDAELGSEVGRLLSQYEDASSFIEEPLLNGAPSIVLSSILDERDEDSMVGKILGNYRIEREIGRGGMGAVYEAVRADDEFRLRAAIKVVKRGIDTDFVLRRFRNERQILANLDHPYITRLIDGGTTDDGRPYFVMDHIEGLQLHRYCDSNRLTIRERLQLFCRVCEAVEYAHQRLVIHRDLKPSNIIVTADASPRLLDFGIAKLLDADHASDTLQPTATSLRMMTVDYASPEQVRGEKVGFTTDVYSLGILLYELLSGYRPYKLKSRAPHDIARAICDEAIDPPSVAFADGGERWAISRSDRGEAAAERIARNRRESTAQLPGRLRGNLDNITLKCLQKSPDDRYASVAALRADVERHLNGETITVDLTGTESEIPSAPPITSGSRLVAVLPLSLMGKAPTEDTDESYLTIGLADAIITRLASVRKLTVRPTSSITRYNEGPVNPLRAGVELGVDFVLDGRMRRFGHRIRISLQLLDVANGTAIWARQFDEDVTDVLQLEDAISEQVATALIPHLTGEERQMLAKRGTDIPEAYEAYLKGRFYWNQFTAQSLPKAIDSFKKAIEFDPDYALAHVGIADFYIWANIYGLIPVRESYALAAKAARRALEIDDHLGEAYASLALLTSNHFHYAEAEKLYKRAVELNPNYPHVHEWYSALLVYENRRSEAISEIYRAESLDPLSLRTKTLVAWTLYQCGELEAALKKAEEIIGLDENYPQGHLQRSNVLCELGRPAEALISVARGSYLMPDSELAAFMRGYALAAAGRKAEALDLADEMKRRSETHYVKPIFLSFAYTAAGDLDQAFSYLEKAVDEFDPWLVWLATDPKLHELRNDDRFEPLYKRTRTPDTTVSAELEIDDFAVPTSVGYSDSKTMLGSEMPTLELRSSFFARNYGKLGAAALLVAFLIFAYSSGILTFSFSGSRKDAAGSSSTGNRSVAVLPFQNATGDPANDYLSDGMSEMLMGRMSLQPDIKTISRSAVFSYKDHLQDPAAVGKELGVDNVLTGSVSKDGDRITVKLDLLDVRSGRPPISTSFTETGEHVVRLQEAIAAWVRNSLELSSSVASGKKSYTQNNDAFQLYLQAEYHRQKGTPADHLTAIEMYQKALQLDPEYALAYQGLSITYRSAAAYGAMMPAEAFPLAKESAQKALAIDPSLSTPYVTLASVTATYDWNYADAEEQYKQAIERGVNNAEAHYSYGNFLVAMGRTDEALNEYNIARQLDPPSLNIPTNIGWALYIAGRYDEASTQIKQVIARDPSFARAYMNLGEITQEQGRFDEAIGYFKKAKELSSDPLADMAIGHAYAVAGRKAEAMKIAADLEEKVRTKEVSPFLPAVVYAGLNEKDKAFYWLERAYQERSNWLTLIKVGRRLKNLHGDPRFDDLLKRVGFTKKRL